jgi:high-affinity iron transporter
MIGALIIVFREVIEAGLVIGIVLAATNGALGCRLWVAGGALAGLLGAGLVAVFMGAISQAFGGLGQELLNAAILGSAVLMLAWHSIWMAGHGKAMAAELFAAGRNAVTGSSTHLALALVVAAAVMREGAEVVLFLYGIAATDGSTAASTAAGGFIGLGLGGLVSALTYLGLVRIPPRHLFSVTGWLITFLAAGMAAQCVGFLQQAGVVDAMGQTAWNSSWLLKDSSIFGRVLHTLIGYDDRPTLLQLAAYIATVVGITGLTRWAARPPKGTANPAINPAE